MLKQKGFTLIELMIVVVIIGILAAVAIPQYTDHLRRARLADATSQLASYKTQMEQFYSDRRTYAGATIWSNGAALPVDCSTADETMVSRSFDFICQNYDPAGGLPTDAMLTAAGRSNPDQLGFLLVARGKNNMVNFSFAIDSLGRRYSNHNSGNFVTGGTINCWKQSPGGGC